MRKIFVATMLILLLAPFNATFSQGVTPVLSTDIKALTTNNKALIILDVRTPAEFASGHLPNAVNIDINQPGAFDTYARLDKTKTYLIYCRTRNRSGVVANYMIQQGFTKLYQMTDGMVGWSANQLPLVK